MKDMISVSSGQGAQQVQIDAASSKAKAGVAADGKLTMAELAQVAAGDGDAATLTQADFIKAGFSDKNAQLLVEVASVSFEQQQFAKTGQGEADKMVLERANAMTSVADQQRFLQEYKNRSGRDLANDVDWADGNTHALGAQDQTGITDAEKAAWNRNLVALGKAKTENPNADMGEVELEDGKGNKVKAKDAQENMVQAATTQNGDDDKSC